MVDDSNLFALSIQEEHHLPEPVREDFRRSKRLACHLVQDVIRQGQQAGVFEVISFGEAAIADEGASDGGEGEEVFGFAFVAAVESAAAGEPGNGTLYDPAVPAQAGGGLDAASGQVVRDASTAEPLPQVAVVVPLVTVQLAGLVGLPSAVRGGTRWSGAQASSEFEVFSVGGCLLGRGGAAQVVGITAHGGGSPLLRRRGRRCVRKRRRRERLGRCRRRGGSARA